MTSPRETARQIAEQYGPHDYDCPHVDEYQAGRPCNCQCADELANVITHTLSQATATAEAERDEARQESAWRGEKLQEVGKLAGQLKTENDELRTGLDVAKAVVANLELDVARANDVLQRADEYQVEELKSAARTALLEAAEDCPWDENFAKWLRGRAAKLEHP